jgi:hypothetical protein
VLPNEKTYNFILFSFFSYDTQWVSQEQNEKKRKRKKKGGQAILKNEMPQRRPTY